MASTNKRSGKAGKVSVDATEVPITAWTMSEEAETDDVTDTADAGWISRLSSLKGATGTFDAVWDITAIPYDATPGLEIGKRVALILQVGEDADNFDFTLNAIIKSLEFNSDIRSAIKWSCGFESDGAVTPPTTP